MEEVKPSVAPSVAPSAHLFYANITSFSEKYINDKILANNNFNNEINIIKDIRNYYETETNNYKKKLGKYKHYINIAEIPKIIISSNNNIINSNNYSINISCINRYRFALFYTYRFATATVWDS